MSQLFISASVLLFALAPSQPSEVPSAVADETAPAVQVAVPSTTIEAVQNWQEDVMFYIFAILTVGSALGVVVARNVVRMAGCLFATFGAVAMLFFLMQAYFIGAVQLIVYAGGILILLVFGIMLTSNMPWVRFQIKKWELGVSGLVCAVLCAGLAHLLVHARWPGVEQTTNVTVEQFGESLLSNYLIPFELAGVVLMVVMIGAAYLARQEKS